MNTALTIAGSDNSSGAGVQADLKVFKDFNVYGFSAITALTSQNSTGVKNSYPVPQEVLDSQLKTIFEDFNVNAIKIGMIQTLGNLNVIVENLNKFNVKNIVLDPVLKSSSGKLLLEKKAIKILIDKLLPIVDVITPNKDEAEVLTEIKINDLDDAKKACIYLKSAGAKNILLKGGHFISEDFVTDIFFNGEDFFYLKYPKIRFSENVHGTGCVLSSAIAANLSLRRDILKSVEISRAYMQYKLQTAVELGRRYLYIV